MIIMEAKVFIEKAFNNNLGTRTVIAQSESGFIDDELAFKWLWHFHYETKGRSKGKYRLLLFDGHGSHMTYEFISLCEQLDIIAFCLIAHSTHLTQPLDVACFQSEKHWHSRSIEDHVRAGKGNFTKYTFLKVLKQIRTKTFTKRTIKSAFKRAGVYPLCPEKVLQALKLVEDTKLGDEEVGGRTYNYDPLDPSKAIQVPASNAPKPRVAPQERTIWEAQPGEDDSQYFDYLDQSDFETDSELEDEQALPGHREHAENVPDDDVRMEPPTSDRLTDYNEEESGIYGLDPHWYKKNGAPFLQTPYGAPGISAHSAFLNKHEHEMSSPSKRVSNQKFRKGAEIEALKGAVAQEKLNNEASLDDIWGSSSLFVNEEDANRHVKPVHGGRVIRSGEGLRLIKERNEREQLSEMEKAVRDSDLAARKVQALKDKEQRELEKQERLQRRLEEDAERKRKREEREQKAVENKVKKAEKAAAIEQKWMDAIARGERPKGRMPKSVMASQAPILGSQAVSMKEDDEDEDMDFEMLD